MGSISFDVARGAGEVGHLCGGRGMSQRTNPVGDDDRSCKGSSVSPDSRGSARRVELPPERPQEGNARSCCTPCVGSWGREHAKTLAEAGSTVGRARTRTFSHPKREIRIVVHGDEFVAAGNELELEFAMHVFCKKHPIKVRGIRGPGPNDAKEVTIFNRIIRWKIAR